MPGKKRIFPRNLAIIVITIVVILAVLAWMNTGYLVFAVAAFAVLIALKLYVIFLLLKRTR